MIHCHKPILQHWLRNDKKKFKVKCALCKAEINKKKKAVRWEHTVLGKVFKYKR